MKIEQILDDVLKNPRVKALLKPHQFTRVQLLRALPLLMTIVDESKESAPHHYVFALEANKHGEIVAVKAPTKHLKAQNYLLNIWSLKHYPLTFETAPVFAGSAQNAFLAYSKLFELPGSIERGIYLRGAAGTGKTRLLKQFAKIAAEHNKTVFYLPMHEIVNIVKNDFDRKGPLISELKRVNFLFIDDLGAESVYHWCRDEVLYPVLAYRKEHKLPTFVGSKLTFDELIRAEAKTVDKRTLDRDQAERLVFLLKQITSELQLTN